MRCFELTDKEWSIIQPLLPNKPRGVPRADDRRVINGILWRFRAGTSWRDVPERHGPRTTLCNRFTRWRGSRDHETFQWKVSPENRVWDRILAAASKAYDDDIAMIDSACVRVRQHGAAVKRGARTPTARMAAWDIPAAG